MAPWKHERIDMPAGEFRWLTVVSPEAPDGVELVLEPNAHPAAQAYQQAIVADGIPATSFAVDDVQAEFDLHEATLRSREGAAGTTVPAILVGPTTILSRID